MTKILLVEDDKSLREIYGVRLLAEGYDIVSAGDGEEALAMAIKERPQLILSDVMMPKISGFDMLDILRSTTETKQIKVIMMTALSSQDQRARGEALGADRYLVKSQVGIEDVVRTVHDVLGDNVVNIPTAQQNFGTPGPSAVARPAPTVAPRQAYPQPEPQQPQPASQPAPVAPVQYEQPQPAPAPPVQPQPYPQPAAVAPQAPAPPVYPNPTTAGPASYQLPQPTAPFSSTRPASLGDRVIHPLTDQQPPVDVGSLINEELNRTMQPAPLAPQASVLPLPASQVGPIAPTPGPAL